MDYKKLDKIKTPEKWLDQLDTAVKIEKEGQDSSEIPVVKKKGQGMRTAAILICILVFVTGITAAATSSDVFKEFLSGIFGQHKVTEIDREQKKDAQSSNLQTPDIVAESDDTIDLKDNMSVAGKQESFVSEYHYDKEDNEVVDRVYEVVKGGLRKLEPVQFQGNYDGEPFSFEYVTVGSEIYGFNYSGGIDEVFHYVNGNTVYAALYQMNADNEIKKECIAALNLKTGEVTKLSGDKMICNFVMSPGGKVILCNHRSDVYWSVFDLAEKTEKRVDKIDGYAHTDEIEFVDDYHILTLGEPYYEDNTEYYTTRLINLSTGEVDKEYNGYGEINMQWSYTLKDKTLNLVCITNNKTFSVENVDADVQPVSSAGDYVLFGNWEEDDTPHYLVNLQNHTSLKLEIPKAMKSNLEIHLVKNKKMMLLANDKKAYLVDISSL